MSTWMILRVLASLMAKATLTGWNERRTGLWRQLRGRSSQGRSSRRCHCHTRIAGVGAEGVDRSAMDDKVNTTSFAIHGYEGVNEAQRHRPAANDVLR